MPQKKLFTGLSLDDYILKDTLGTGSFGRVRLVQYKKDNSYYALKILKKSEVIYLKQVDHIKMEKAILEVIEHPFIVNLFGSFQDPMNLYLMMEYVIGGEFFSHLRKAGRFPNETARFYAAEIVLAFEHLHTQSIIYRDLKPENLLLDEQSNLKISDFGLSALYGTDQDSTLLKTTCGTPNYVAPEVLADNGYSGFAADIWSCGVILYVLLAGFLPFDEPAMSVLFRKIMKGDFSYPSWFSKNAKELLGMILKTDPVQRATIAQIKDSVWYKDGGFTEEELRNENGTGLDPTVQDADFGEADEVDESDVSKLYPQKINAFELITMLGGLDITPIFDNSEASQAKLTRFASKLTAPQLTEELTKALDSLGLTYEKPVAFKLKINFETDHGPGTCTAQIFIMAPGLHMVDFRRGQSDFFGFFKVFKAIKEKLAHVIDTEETRKSVPDPGNADPAAG
mmetsp:Transcript_10092/g.29732  ORF Transcript_10092/g.29732 Transcript_10092/m.29732 type:complete len:454 (+) Transcript_10092:114-1475(+)